MVVRHLAHTTHLGPSMRLHPALLTSLLVAPPPTAAQVPADHPGWRLGGGVEAVRFGHVAVSRAVPGVAAEVRPTGRPAVHLSAGKSYEAWNVELEAGWAGGHIEAGNDVLSIQDKTADVTRYRLAVGIGRRLALAGSGEVSVAVVPTLDLWAVEGATRVRAGRKAGCCCASRWVRSSWRTGSGWAFREVPSTPRTSERSRTCGDCGRFRWASDCDSEPEGSRAQVRRPRGYRILRRTGCPEKVGRHTARTPPAPGACHRRSSSTRRPARVAPRTSHIPGCPAAPRPQRSEGSAPYQRSVPRRRRAPRALPLPHAGALRALRRCTWS